MSEIRGSVAETVEADPRALFSVITDINRLPEWNEIIQQVVDCPARVEQGAEWVVRLKAMGSAWNSRSRVEEHDEGTLRFAYRSQTDDGNPSYARWNWQITDDPAGARVTVDWEVHPKTFWRRVLLARIRHRQLPREVRASIQAAARLAAAA
jgi:ribosome-associated toxin RatA of RatAB toxin-antitoxin module